MEDCLGKGPLWVSRTQTLCFHSMLNAPQIADLHVGFILKDFKLKTIIFGGSVQICDLFFFFF